MVALTGASDGDDTPAPVRTGPSTTAPSTTAPQYEAGTWRTLPAGPLSPRSRASAVWTGTEMVIAGGLDRPPCQPNDRCEPGEHEAEELRDGAAYDPATDAWRTIAPAPIAFDLAPAVWTGDVMLVVARTAVARAPARLLAYDPTRDTWEERSPPPGDINVVDSGYGDPAWTGELAVFAREANTTEKAEWAYDPASDRWIELPRDPLGCSYDRSMVAVAGSLVLLAVPCSGTPGGDAPALYRAARLDLDTREWHRLPGSGIADDGCECWIASGDRVVSPSWRTVDGGPDDYYDRPYPTGGVLDVATETWSDLTPPPAPEREASGSGPSIARGYWGPAGAWVAAGNWLYSPSTGAWNPLPPTPDAARDRAAVWTGHEIITWGGSNEGYTGQVATGASYTPPPPP